MATFRSSGFTAKPLAPVFNSGSKVKTAKFNETITAAENADGDVWILGGPYEADDMIVGVYGQTPAFTSATDNDFGFYTIDKDGAFVAVDADALVDGADLSSALTYRELLATLNTSLDTTQTIGELLGITKEDAPRGGLYLAMTMNTASTAVSEILNLKIEVAQGSDT